jgi:D-alanyl-lipoteichoic acid acyltransferase DltB (MBOAT superfamily)
MDLHHIFFFALIAAGLNALRSPRVRRWGLLVLSVVAVFWLQPLTSLRHFGFWLPTGTLLFSVAGWAVTRTGRGVSSEDRRTALTLFGIVLLLGLSRFLPSEILLTAARPPRIPAISVVLGVFIVLSLLLRLAARRSIAPAVMLGALILLCFLALKTDPISSWMSRVLRGWTSRDVALASSSDLRWFGFSYLALRILHTLLDRIGGRLPEVSLQEYVIYTVFFPSISAGPIDRVERFVRDLRAASRLHADEAFNGGVRILLGLVKKFVLADSLHLISLNPYNANLVQDTTWMWVLLYAYAFHIYLDFSGYTDIALGMGRLAGVELPENFERPYLQPNIRMFWNGWHITLARWFRTYYFNPLTRRLKKLKRTVPQTVVVFLMQTTTMALIGIWHGVRGSFLLWGLWHGLGLFLHNRWTAFLRRHPGWGNNRWLTSKGAVALGTVLTFHFVLLGWVLFALSDLVVIQRTYQVLFGMRAGSMHAGG